MNPFAYLCAEMIDKPLLMREESAQSLYRTLSARAIGGAGDRLDAETLKLAEMRRNAISDGDSEGHNYGCQIIDGVGIIPVRGSLLQHRNWLWEIFGFTSYELIELQAKAMSADENVRVILMDFDTPGGLASGCFDTARMLKAVDKPMIGAVHDMACSAGYALISSCDEIYSTETGDSGSIGVYTLHADFTRALDRDGIELTMVRAGERKARGGPYERADKKTMVKKQSSVERTWDMFVKLVSDHRNLAAQGIYDLEGDWFDADESMKHGLIDGIGSFEDIFNRARSLAN